MKRVVRLMIAGLFLVALPFMSSAQRSDWRVVQSSGDTLIDCVLQAFDDSMLTLGCNGSKISLPVDSVDLLFYHKDSGFLTGVVTGGAAGFLLGAVMGPANYTEGEPGFARFPGYLVAGIEWGLIGAIGGSAVGGIIGAAFGGGEIYRFSGMTYKAKVNTIRNVMLTEWGERKLKS